MAYTVIPTITTGDVATAAWGNTHLKDNFAAGVPDIFTADGEVAIGTGADAAEAVAILDSSNRLKHEYGGLEFDLSAVTTNDTVGGSGAGTMEVKTPVTQAEAEAGTSTRFSLWSPQRWKQALDALAGVTQATQAAIEAETNENTYAPPDLLRHIPGAAKGYCTVASNGVLQSNSYNIASTSRDSTGVYTVNWDTDHANTNFSCTMMIEENDISKKTSMQLNTPAVGSIKIRTGDDGIATDHAFHIVTHGDQ